MMNPFFNQGIAARNPVANMMQVLNQAQQIKQNPGQIGQLLRTRGIINDQQAKDISKMGGDYAQIGQYLINSRVMPQPPQHVVEQAKQVINQ